MSDSQTRAGNADLHSPAHSAGKISAFHVLFMLIIHLGAVAAFAFFSWQGLVLMLSLYVATGLGITVGFHRLLAHRSFRTNRAVSRIFATLGALALQGGPLRWVADHRLHHLHSDSDGDPHNISRGLFFAHIGWVFRTHPAPVDRARIELHSRDVAADPYMVWLEKYAHGLGLLVGVLLLVLGGWSLFLWGFCARLVLLYHSTWLVNSAAHRWGHRPFSSPGTNNWLVALLAFGEGWHNNHHAWPSSAQQGLRPWEFDVSWALIRLLRTLGLAWDVTRVNLDAEHERGGSLVRL